MKGIKKYFKVTICFMAFAVCSLLLAFSPATSAVYAALDYTATNYNLAMNSIHMPRKVIDASANESLEIPLISAGEFDGYKIKVVDPTGAINTYEGVDTIYFAKTEEQDKVRVKYITNGTYKIMYVMVDADGNEHYSNTYEVTVSNAKYTLSFTDETTGEEKLIRTEYKTNDLVKLPIAIANSEEVLPVVTHNNATVATSRDGNHVTFTATEEGVYTVKYLYAEGNRPNASFTINISDDFELPTADSISLINDITMPSVKIGQTDIELPKLALKRGETSNISYNVKSIKIVKSSNGAIYQELNSGVYNNYTFDFTVEKFNGITEYSSEFAGEYKVIYTLVDEYGLEHEETFKLNVTTALNPTVYLAYDYTTGGEVDKTAEYDLKSKFSKDSILLPAIYAEDALNDNNLTYVRYIRHVDSNTIFYVDNLLLNSSNTLEEIPEDNAKRKNISEDENIGDYTKAVEFKFDEDGFLEGDYVLEYQAISQVFGTRKSSKTSYTFTVVDGSIVPSSPVVTLNNDKTYVVVGETVKLSMTSSDSIDARLKNKVLYYTVGDDSQFATNLDAVIAELSSDRTSNVLDNSLFITKMQTRGYTDIAFAEYDIDNNNYSFDVDASSTIKVVAVAINDYGKVGLATDSINIKDINESVAPTYQIVTADENDIFDNTGSLKSQTIYQKTNVKLPTVQFTDSDTDLELRVSYYVDSPETETGILFKYPQKYSAKGNKISGAVINASEAGIYHVCYTAIDDARNVTTVYFSFEVEEYIKPAVVVSTGNSISVKTGETVTFNAHLEYDGTKYDDEVIITDIDYVGSEFACIPSGDPNSYVFDGEGTYTITFAGSHNGIDAYTATVIVKVTRPALAFEDDYSDVVNSYISNEVYVKGDVVTLPMITANNGAYIDVTVKNSSGENIEISRGINSFTFEVDSDVATYKVVYTAVAYGKTISSSTFEIKVGDAIAPVLKVNETVKADLQDDIVYDGENQIEYVITKSDKTLTIKATSNGKEIFNRDLGLTITDKNNTGSVSNTNAWNNLEYTLTGDNVTGSNGNYVISGTGSCTLTIKTTDTNDNISNSIVIKFDVVEENDATEENDTVVGIVLIVISLVVLIGVILFFLLTGKKNTTNSKNTSKNKNKIETEENKDVEVQKNVEAKEDENVVVEEKTEIIEQSEEQESKSDDSDTNTNLE